MNSITIFGDIRGNINALNAEFAEMLRLCKLPEKFRKLPPLSLARHLPQT